ncbi:MAG: MBL fold metallo-hydrolase [Candidatus Eisenbacteria sp.]|nr:MBL fold metallo-hydrolase [Candidatus Eisenbacteria bacterium]
MKLRSKPHPAWGSGVARSRLWRLLQFLAVLLMANSSLTESGLAEPTPESVRGGRKLSLTIVYDNNSMRSDLRSEWGFSCVIEGLEKTVLFDTGGSSSALLANMRTLGIDPLEIEVVVLSHVHRDHTGGLAGFLAVNNNVTVYMPASFPASQKNGVRSAGALLIEVDEPQRILPGLYTTGQMGNRIREQAVYIEARDGLVVITGCAHPGVARIAARANELGRQAPFLVAGGFHLIGSSRSAIERVIGRLKELGITRTVPTHCTGDQARAMFSAAFGEGYDGRGLGAVITLDLTGYAK